MTHFPILWCRSRGGGPPALWTRLALRAALCLLALALLYGGLVVYCGVPVPMRVVTGTSMQPSLYAGDVILLKGVRFSRIRPGDVVAYRPPSGAWDFGREPPGSILHRVVGINAEDGQRILLTRGDNSGPDPWPITPEMVEGRLALRIPALGRPLAFFSDTRAR